MKVEIARRTDKYIIIEWEDEVKGFGTLTIKFDEKLNDYVIDSECMSLDFILEVLRNIESNEL